MLVYPNLVAALDGQDLDDLEARSGVPRCALEAILTGGWAVAIDVRARLAEALGVSEEELARTVTRTERGDIDHALFGPLPSVTDPATLRAIDGR